MGKGLDTARSASDVSAHLEKAKAAAQVATNVASAAASDAAAASKEAASAGLSAADPNKLVALAKDSAAKVGDAASAAADAAQQSARGASSILSARSADDKKEEKGTNKEEVPEAVGKNELAIGAAEKEKLAQAVAKTDTDLASWQCKGDEPWSPRKDDDQKTTNL